MPAYWQSWQTNNAFSPVNLSITSMAHGMSASKFLQQVGVVFSCDQAAIRTLQSICPSVCLYVCYIFFTMFLSWYQHKIFTSCDHWQKWCPCKRSRSEVKSQGHRGQKKFCPDLDFWDCKYSLNSQMTMKPCTKLAVAKSFPIVFLGNPSNFEVTKAEKSIILTQIECFRTVTPVWFYPWLWNGAESLM